MGKILARIGRLDTVRAMTDETWAPDQVLHGLSRIGFGVPWLLNMLGNAVGKVLTVNEKMGYPHGPDVSRSMERFDLAGGAGEASRASNYGAGESFWRTVG